jgi:hypothetical protein
MEREFERGQPPCATACATRKHGRRPPTRTAFGVTRSKKIRAINGLIGSYNLCVPAIHLQLAPLEPQDELRLAQTGAP